MPLRVSCLLTACTICIAPILAAASDAFPHLLAEPIPAATTQTDPLPPLQLGDIVIRLEETTLAEVQQHLNAGVIRHTGDAGESLTFLCYTLGSRQRLWLGSGEMGGGTRIDSVAAHNLPKAARPTAACPKLPAATAIQFANSLWLGSTQQQVSLLLGQGKVIHTGRLYAFEKPLQNGTLSSTLQLRYTKGRISDIQASHITSH